MIENENSPFTGIINGCALAIALWAIIGSIITFFVIIL